MPARYYCTKSKKPMKSLITGKSTTKAQNTLRLLLGAAMLGAGIAHLTFARKAFRAQVPRWLPTNESFQDFVVVASGVVEISFGLAMLLGGKYKGKTGIALAVFYVLIFPGNISQYTNSINSFGLNTDGKRMARLFFQPVLVWAALWSTGYQKGIPLKKQLQCRQALLQQKTTC